VRCKHIAILIAIALLATAVFATPASAANLSLKQLKSQLRSAEQKRQKVRVRLRTATTNLASARELHAATHSSAITPPAGMTQALAARLLADGVVSDTEVTALAARASKMRRLTRRANAKVKALQTRVRRRARIASWSRRGTWKPLIQIAAKKFGISAAGLYRLMILESNGRRTVGSTYKGLFQYCPSTWSGTWNPWRHQSIYDGWAQIRATAYALSKGMGRSQWPNTYPMAF
jgi:hypothetical protein